MAQPEEGRSLPSVSQKDNFHHAQEVGAVWREAEGLLHWPDFSLKQGESSWLVTLTARQTGTEAYKNMGFGS